MLYSDGKGKYEKAYNYLFKKMVPESGRASNPLGEALRLVSRVYFRLSNDGDSYGDCIEYGMVPDFGEKKFPFDKEYAALGRELDSHLNSSSGYDKAVDLVLLHIMLSLSSESNIYNPETNRLVPLNSAAGEKALKALDLNSVFINYCGKNEEWLPETLRKDGVKISKVLSEETRKELKCDTVQEFYRKDTSGYVKRKPVKVTLSKDNTILSKKFSRIAAEHKKSVKVAEKKDKELQKRREQQKKSSLKTKAKYFSETKLYYEQLRDMTVSKRADVLQRMGKKAEKNMMVKMLVAVFIQYRSKKVTTKAQIKTRAEVLARLVKGLNDAGKYISDVLASQDPKDTIYYLDLDPSLNKRLDDMLLDILGDSEAVDRVYNGVKYN
jgi:hypothetical protein